MSLLKGYKIGTSKSMENRLKKILKAILLGLIPIFCLAILVFFIYVLVFAIKEAGGGDGAMVLMILVVVWIVSSAIFYNIEK